MKKDPTALAPIGSFLILAILTTAGCFVAGQRERLFGVFTRDHADSSSGARRQVCCKFRTVVPEQRPVGEEQPPADVIEQAVVDRTRRQHVRLLSVGIRLELESSAGVTVLGLDLEVLIFARARSLQHKLFIVQFQEERAVQGLGTVGVLEAKIFDSFRV